MTTEISKNNITMLKGILEADSIQKQFANALKDNKDLFIASIIDLYNGDASLQACEPKAIVCEALKAATLKLPINKALGFSYIVVYNNSKKQPNGQWVKVPTPTFVLGYKGYIQMAMRTGQYKTLNCDVVYDGQLKGHNLLSGEIDLSGQKKSDKVIGYFAYYKLLNGMEKTLYMSVEDMAAYAKRYSPSVSKDTTVEMLMAKAQEVTFSAGKGVGWMGNFSDMALKTCMRRLISKYGYLSIEMQGALEGEIKSEQAESSSAIQNTTAPKQVNFEDVNFEEIKQEVSMDETKKIDAPDF